MNSAKIILMAVGLLFTAMSVASCSRSPEQIANRIASGEVLSKTDYEVMSDYILDACDHVIDLMDDYDEPDIRKNVNATILRGGPKSAALGFYIGCISLLEKTGILDTPEENRVKAIEEMRRIEEEFPYFLSFGHVLYAGSENSAAKEVVYDSKLTSKLLILVAYPDRLKIYLQEHWHNPIHAFVTHK